MAYRIKYVLQYNVWNKQGRMSRNGTWNFRIIPPDFRAWRKSKMVVIFIKITEKIKNHSFYCARLRTTFQQKWLMLVILYLSVRFSNVRFCLWLMYGVIQVQRVKNVTSYKSHTRVILTITVVKRTDKIWIIFKS